MFILSGCNIRVVDIMKDNKDYILRTKNLCKSYKGFKALDNLNINIPKGAIYGFVGKNGSGKTTLIRLICSLQSPSSGAIFLFGVRNGTNGYDDTRKRIGAVVETPAFYPDMTAKKNLMQAFRIKGLDDNSNDILKLVELADTDKKKVKDFSLGMKQRLGIALALVGKPDFIILDEPVNGLDPQGIIELRDIIHKLNTEHGITFLISSHILDELSRIATHYGFIDNGHIVKELSASELEAAVRNGIKAEVTNAAALADVLDGMNVEYKILSDTNAVIYNKVNITKLVLKLLEKNCELISVTETEYGLEDYFIELMGGGENA